MAWVCPLWAPGAGWGCLAEVPQSARCAQGLPSMWVLSGRQGLHALHLLAAQGAPC